MLEILTRLSDISILIAFLVTLFKWRSLPGAARLIGIQIVVTVVVELYGWYLGSRNQPNAWVYNIYQIPDTFLMSFAGYRLTEKPVFKKVILSLLASYLLLWFAFAYYDRLSVLANFVFLFECIILTGIFLLLLIQWYEGESKNSIRNPMIVISLAIIIYYGCNIPLFGTLNYMNKHYPEMAKKLYSINSVLNMVKYLSIASGFLMFRNKEPESKMRTS